MGCKCIGCPKWKEEDTKGPADSAVDIAPSPTKSYMSEVQGSQVKLVHKEVTVVGLYRLGDGEKEVIGGTLSDAPLAANERDTILRSLRPLLPFQHLPFPQLESLAKSVRRYTLSPGQLVFSENTWAHHCCVLGAGSLKVERDGKEVAVMKAKAAFGEEVLMMEVKRSISLRALSEAVIWTLDRLSFRDYLRSFNHETYTSTKDIIAKTDLFSLLTPLQLDAVTQIATYVSFPQDTVIITEGYRGEVCYILRSGTVNCVQTGDILGQLSTGDYFGEQALLYGGKRTCTVVAVTDVQCVAVRREDLEVVIGGNLQSVLLQNALQLAITRSPLSILTKTQREALMSVAELSSWEQKDILIPAGKEKGSGIWVILTGQVKEEDGEVLYTDFACLGITDTLSSAVSVYPHSLVITSPTADIAYIPRLSLEAVLHASLSTALLHSQAYLSLTDTSHILRYLPPATLSKITHSLHIQDYKDKTLIVKENHTADAYFILLSGTLRLEKDGHLVELVTNQRCLFDLEVVKQRKYEYTVITEGPVSCWTGNREELLRALSPNLVQWLLRLCEFPQYDVSLGDFRVLSTLNSSPIGSTWVVRRPGTLGKYQLKVVEKSQVTQAESRRRVLEEREVRGKLRCVGVERLVKTFKDAGRLYFLLEYVPGVFFSDILDYLPLPMTPFQACFYTANLLLLLHSLHSHSILLRSLTPSTILIDSDGYPCLTDLSAAKTVSSRTYTLLGHPHYTSPEVILGTGYSLDADYWALGVVTYLCVCGKLPFGDTLVKPMDIYDRILNSKLKFPQNVEVGNAKSLIETLLNRNPAIRHCGDPDKIKAHPWFSLLNWVTPT